MCDDLCEPCHQSAQRLIRLIDCVSPIFTVRDLHIVTEHAFPK